MVKQKSCQQEKKALLLEQDKTTKNYDDGYMYI
jgi:hypothetical protein